MPSKSFTFTWLTLTLTLTGAAGVRWDGGRACDVQRSEVLISGGVARVSARASSVVEAARLWREGVGEDRSRRRASLAQFDARRAKAQRAGSSKQEWQASERGLTTNCRLCIS